MPYIYRDTCRSTYQAWDFSADPRILKFWKIFFFFFENLTLECIKTAVFDTRNPKSPYRGRGPPPPPPPPHTPTPPLGRYALSTLGQFAPSLSYLPLFSNISCLMDPEYVGWLQSAEMVIHCNSTAEDMLYDCQFLTSMQYISYGTLINWWNVFKRDYFEFCYTVL